jgi:hypothetical protein
VCQSSDRDLYGGQLQSRTSPSFDKRISLTMQATHEPCDVSFTLINIVGHALASIKVHDHFPSKGGCCGCGSEAHRDSNTKAHYHIWILTNLCFMMTTATHLCIFCRIRSFTRWSLGADWAKDSWLGGDHVEGHLRTGGLKVAIGRGKNHRCAVGPGTQ